jgi:hypothetical protein
MYSTCLFCHRALGKNDAIEHFPVGVRLAFDSEKGRLWVICRGCGRWNLTPIEERWEAIEECERNYRNTTVRVSTDNVGLARLRSGFELVRIGAPLRPEFAAWRYGKRFGRRRRTLQIVAGTSTIAAGAMALAFGPVIAPALTIGAISVVVVPGLTTIMGVVPMVGALALKDYLTHERVVAQFAQGKRVVTVRAKNLVDVELNIRGDEDASLHVPHDSGWAHFEGTAAVHAASVLLAGTNRYGATSDQVSAAVGHIEQHGDASNFLSAAAQRGGWRGRVFSVLNTYRGLGTMRLNPTECLALEMAMHEETERHALDGELATLKDAWREAEQIAEICDNQLTPGFEQLLGRRRHEGPDEVETA